MLEAIRRYFGARIQEPPAATADPDRRLRIATCALLLEAAHADEDLSAEESRAVLAMARERFDLRDDELAELVRLADRERRDAVDLFQFTRLIAEHFDRAQRLAVLELLWKVVYADGRLEAREDALMHKLCTLLGLTHRELIALKLRARDR